MAANDDDGRGNGQDGRGNGVPAPGAPAARLPGRDQPSPEAASELPAVPPQQAAVLSPREPPHRGQLQTRVIAPFLISPLLTSNARCTRSDPGIPALGGPQDVRLRGWRPPGGPSFRPAP